MVVNPSEAEATRALLVVLGSGIRQVGRADAQVPTNGLRVTQLVVVESGALALLFVFGHRHQGLAIKG
jgi:hypothetical protein